MKKIKNQKVISLVVAVMMALSTLLTGCGGGNNINPTPTPFVEPSDVGTDRYGLYVADNGMLYLGGNIFYGYGINMFSSFIDALNTRKQKSFFSYDTSIKRSEIFRADFQFAKLYDLPVVRIPFSTWDYSGYQLYNNNSASFFAVMDKVVACAEENHVGIIASLMWNQDTMAFYKGEKRSEFGNVDSKTMQFAKQYVTDIVTRYKDSPAIWGWEIGNEYNLSADLQSYPGGSFLSGEKSYFDWYTSDELVVFYEEIGKTIREIDPDRMITTGNGENRTFAMSAHNSALQRTNSHWYEIDWTLDNRSEFMEMCAYFTPDPLDTICFHFQHGSLNDENVHLTMTHTLENETLTTPEYVKLYVDAGRKVNKAVYFGEFGDFIDVENESNPQFDRALFEENFKIVMDGLVDADLQLATGWFNWADIGRFNHTQYNLSEVNIYKMNMLKEINNKFSSEGKQKLDEYWSKYPCDGSSFGFVKE